MKMEELFIYNLDTYTIIDKCIDKIFLKNNGLPDQVLNEKFKYFRFLEDVWLFEDLFWKDIQYLSSKYNDEGIIVAVIDPDPFEYHYQNFSRFNAGILASSMNFNEFYSFLMTPPKDYDADSIASYWKKIVIFSHSSQWAIYGDKNYETILLALKNEEDLDALQANWGTLDIAIDSWISQLFPRDNYIVPHEIVTTLEKNYGGQAV